MGYRGRHVVLLISIVLMTLDGAVTLRADVTGSILGTVHDRSGAVVAGPGLNNTDFGIAKHTVIKESMAFEIRAEFFNIFNHAQFNNPDGNFNSDLFGVVTSTRLPGREGQISAKFFW